jgi:FeS assembly SUF system protein
VADDKTQSRPKGLFSRVWPGRKESPAEDGTDAADVETTAPADAEPVAARANVDGSAISPEELERLSNDIIAALKTVYDPEIPADIYELGLIYRIDIDDDRNVAIDMTLTAPACPVAGEMPVWVENAVRSVPGVGEVEVKMVFEPAWTTERMSDEAKVALNWY